MTDQLDSLKRALADRYTIQRELGSGGMATVYLARDEKLGRDVALKVLRPAIAAALGAERFLREIEIVAQLSHPNILSLHDCGAGGAEGAEGTERQGGSDAFLYYTMPYVEGETLRDRLNREKQLPIDDALRITKEVADALGYAHSMGVVHRDIKPENILFTAGHALVADFGVAKAVTEAGGKQLTETGITVGTPAYMSPEQAGGDEDVDARSDLYSLGCVLYEMLSGDAPYTASTPQAVLAKKQSEPIPRISVVRETVPPGVEATVTKALQKNPADRFVTAQQLVDALETSSGAIPLAESATRRKRPAWQWVAGLIAVGAVVGGGFALFDGWGSGGTAAAEDIDRLVVAPLENRTGDSAVADWGFVAAEFITRAVDRASIVTVVPASVVRNYAVEELSLDEIARRTGARYAVTGSYSGSADRLRFDVELVDAETGELLRALQQVDGPVDSADVVVAVLSERIAAAWMALLSPDVSYGIARRFSSPPTVEAVRGLLATQEPFCRTEWQETVDQGRSSLERAPDFPPLMLMVALSYVNLGNAREADSVFALIELMEGQLTAPERLLAAWTRAFLDGDRAGRTRAVEELFRRWPARYGYHAGFTALMTNRFEDALERFLASDMDTPCMRSWWPWWRYMTHTYHMLGRYEDELAVAREALQRFPTERPLIVREAVALAGLGQMESLDSLLDYFGDLPPEENYNVGMWETYIALELKALGRQEAYEAVIDRALVWFAALPADTLRFDRARTFYYAERWSDADTLLAALDPLVTAFYERSPNSLVLRRLIDIRGHHGVALAHLGRREEALEPAAWLEQLDRPFLLGWNTRWSAAVAAALGDREGAVRLLQQAYDEGLRLGYFHYRDPDWRPLYGYGPYQEFVRPK